MEDIRHPRAVAIYGLCDPGPLGALRYIGRAYNPASRFAGHLRSAHSETTPSRRWIKSLLDAGQSPEMFVIEESDEDHWEEAEEFYVAYFTALGAELTNIKDGGRGRYTLHPDARQRGPNTREYLAVFPDGMEQHVRNLNRFCWRWGLNPESAKSVVDGLASHTGGFRFAPWGERPKDLGRKPHRIAPWVITHPDGSQTITMSWKQFYRDGGCVPSTLLNSTRTGTASLNGWSAQRAVWIAGKWCAPPTPPPPPLIKHGSTHPLTGTIRTEETKARISQSRRGVKYTEEDRAAISGRYRVTSPDGAVQEIASFKRWCRERGFSETHARRAMLAEIPDYRGWKIEQLAGDPRKGPRAYLVTRPSGEEFTIRSIEEFCRGGEIGQSTLYAALKSAKPTVSGWRIRRLFD